mgnify:CR=1 FL=1
MPYKYDPPEPHLVRKTQADIVDEFRKWREQMGNPNGVGTHDFPIPPKIGGAGLSAGSSFEASPSSSAATGTTATTLTSAASTSRSSRCA